MAKNSGLRIFDYTDYRKYLCDYYSEQKKKTPSFSYRSFAKKAGYNSSGLFKDIVSGRTGMYRDLIARFARGIGLNKKEEAYFESMVYFCQAGEFESRRRHFEDMMRLRDSRTYLMDSNQYEFYSRWYYSAVRELLNTLDFKDDYHSLAKSLNPSITPDQARAAISLLKELNLIKKKEKGHFRPANALITTGDEVKVNSLKVAAFQMGMMDLAKESIDRHPSRHRDVSTLTLSVSKDTFDEMKAEMQAFRKKLMGMAERSRDVDRVYQLNMQFFPLSRIEEKKI